MEHPYRTQGEQTGTDGPPATPHPGPGLYKLRVLSATWKTTPIGTERLALRYQVEEGPVGTFHSIVWDSVTARYGLSSLLTACHKTRQELEFTGSEQALVGCAYYGLVQTRGIDDRIYLAVVKRWPDNPGFLLKSWAREEIAAHGLVALCKLAASKGATTVLEDALQAACKYLSSDQQLSIACTLENSLAIITPEANQPEE